MNSNSTRIVFWKKLFNSDCVEYLELIRVGSLIMDSALYKYYNTIQYNTIQYNQDENHHPLLASAASASVVATLALSMEIENS